MEHWPAGLFPRTMELYPLSATQSFRTSTGRLGQSVTKHRGDRWMCEMDFGSRNPFQSGEMDALIARMQGGAVGVRVPNNRRTKPLGNVETLIDIDDALTELPFSDGGFFADGQGWMLGTVLQAQASLEGATEIVTIGWVPGRDVLAPGDHLELQPGRLHMFIGAAPIRTDSAGAALIPISPPLREDVPQGTPIKLNNTGVRMRMINPQDARNPTVKPMRSSYKISFEEDLR